jgi:hypothetical protein
MKCIMWEQIAIKKDFEAAMDVRTKLLDQNFNVRVGHDLSGHTITVPEAQARRAKEAIS